MHPHFFFLSRFFIFINFLLPSHLFALSDPTYYYRYYCKREWFAKNKGFVFCLFALFEDFAKDFRTISTSIQHIFMVCVCWGGRKIVIRIFDVNFVSSPKAPGTDLSAKRSVSYKNSHGHAVLVEQRTIFIPTQFSFYAHRVLDSTFSDFFFLLFWKSPPFVIVLPAFRGHVRSGSEGEVRLTT